MPSDLGGTDCQDPIRTGAGFGGDESRLCEKSLPGEHDLAASALPCAYRIRESGIEAEGIDDAYCRRIVGDSIRSQRGNPRV